MKTWTIAYRTHAVRADETVKAEFWSLGKNWFYFIVGNVPVKAVYHDDVLSITLVDDDELEPD